MVLTAYFVLSPVTGLFCHRRLADIGASQPGWADAPPQNLTPASGRQDHTTSPSAFMPLVNGTISVHRIPSRVRDDREAPLEWNEMR
jgi:hypothetical protein